jgi:opacity protein-like surface antigen
MEAFMKRMIFLVLLALAFSANLAQADDPDGPRLPCCVKGTYVAGHAGVSLLSDSDVRFFGVEVGQGSNDPGFNVGGALGYDFGVVRTEIEITHRRAQWDEFAIGPTPALPACPCVGTDDDHISATSFMVNGLYDHIFEGSLFSAFLGAGVGAARVSLDSNDGGIVDSDVVFAYQLMVGLGYQITNSTTLTLGYRYFNTTNPEFAILASPGSVIKTEVEMNEVLLGARIAF